jgi:DNA-binding MarR family transcriptional regulator
MNNSFHELTVHINRLNQSFLDSINGALRAKGIYNVNPIQALLISNIGGESKLIKDVNWSGYYLGQNTSYNAIDLAKKGYITREAYAEDKRSAYLSLTEKGKQIIYIIDKVNMSHQKCLKDEGLDVNNINEILIRLRGII